MLQDSLSGHFKLVVAMASLNTERRSKMYNDRPGNCFYFRTHEDKLRFAQRYGCRKVVKERLFDVDFLRELRWPYVDRLERWGWLKLIGMDREAYANVTKQFYFNAHLSKVNEKHEPIPNTKEMGGFHTFLHKNHLFVTHDHVWKALDRPQVRDNAPVFKKKMPGLLEAARRVFRNDELEELPKKINGLSKYDRILHLVISENLLPRLGDHAGVTSEDIWLMDLIKNDNPPNLSCMVMQRMLVAIKFNSTEKITTRGLPYGRLISQIIDDLEVPNLTDEVMPKHHPVPFRKGSPALKGITYNEETGEWEIDGNDNGGEGGENIDIHVEDNANIEPGEEGVHAIADHVAAAAAQNVAEEGNFQDVPMADEVETNSANADGQNNEAPVNEAGQPPPTIYTLARAFDTFRNEVRAELKRFEQRQEDIIFLLRAIESRGTMPLPAPLPDLVRDDNAPTEAPPAQ